MIAVTSYKIEIVQKKWKMVEYDHSTAKNKKDITTIVISFGDHEPRQFFIDSNALKEYNFSSEDAKILFNNDTAEVKK